MTDPIALVVGLTGVASGLTATYLHLRSAGHATKVEGRADRTAQRKMDLNEFKEYTQTITEDNKRLRSENYQLRDLLTSIRSEVDDLHMKVAELQEDNLRSQAHVENCEHDNHALRERVAELEGAGR